MQYLSISSRPAAAVSGAAGCEPGCVAGDGELTGCAAGAWELVCGAGAAGGVDGGTFTDAVRESGAVGGVPAIAATAAAPSNETPNAQARERVWRNIICIGPSHRSKPGCALRAVLRGLFPS